MHDPVNHPDHYTQHPSGVECFQVAKHLSLAAGNALKYCWRADLKNGGEDYRKALWYLDQTTAKDGGSLKYVDVAEEALMGCDDGPLAWLLAWLIEGKNGCLLNAYDKINKIINGEEAGA